MSKEMITYYISFKSLDISNNALKKYIYPNLHVLSNPNVSD